MELESLKALEDKRQEMQLKAAEAKLATVEATIKDLSERSPFNQLSPRNLPHQMLRLFLFLLHLP